MGVVVGTCGWQYRDWRGVLYPRELPGRLWLEEYARQFRTVESNNAFYRLPAPETFADWRDRTPEGFVMAVKASRYLTHLRRLRDPEEPVRRLLSHAEALGDKLGPVLLQLPPTLRADPALLDACLAAFPPDVRVAVEPRHSSWWTPEVRSVLADHGCALCWADRASRPVTPLWRTADWGYVRFHGGRARPWPRYGPQALRSWAERIADAWPPGAEVFAYFNNDHGGAAVLDAGLFARFTAAPGGGAHGASRGGPAGGPPGGSSSGGGEGTH
ncbi:MULTISPECIES: DUF72 domain-containing protein [unclassified Streptomyces]|uniref:DUF72 domain-containing protein n=1 Tax=unclassified Streptomyces TaxID=2593676 RepID=UPI0022B7261B|nr:MULTISPECIES: DUF72 domain-containing protein [unclassified Streptomyces]MCZ7414991.1 DUF72 domain-containing protein [Streptomyces sp. WMMC897]MCZ7431934.1 DUF72 domain-containing protein [Streptomyces sp. WMMC1477]